MIGEHFHLRHDNSQKEALGFHETKRDGISASSKIEDDSVLIKITGKSPQNEDDTDLVCDNFLFHLKNNLDESFRKECTKGTKYVDCLITNGDCDYQIQVVRVITKEKFWKDLAKEGETEQSLSKREVFEMISDSIQHKINKIPEDERPKLTLLLDSNRVQIFTSPKLLTEFTSSYNKFLKSSLFSEIWIAGYDKTATHQLF